MTSGAGLHALQARGDLSPAAFLLVDGPVVSDTDVVVSGISVDPEAFP